MPKPPAAPEPEPDAPPKTETKKTTATKKTKAAARTESEDLQRSLGKKEAESPSVKPPNMSEGLQKSLGKKEAESPSIMPNVPKPKATAAKTRTESEDLQRSLGKKEAESPSVKPPNMSEGLQKSLGKKEAESPSIMPNVPKPKAAAAKTRTEAESPSVKPKKSKPKAKAKAKAAKGFGETKKAVEEEELPIKSMGLVGPLAYLVNAGGGSVLLLTCTALSLLLANIPATAASWANLWATPIGPAFHNGHALSLQLWVNEGLMAIFFFVVGLEIKRELVHGTLRNIKSALLPCIAAFGGMVVPMGVYLAVQAKAGAAAVYSGWAVPMATDIAFAMGVLGFFKSRLPSALSAFLLTLATVDDLGAIAVITVFFATHVKASFVIAACALTAALVLQGQKDEAPGAGVPSFLPYGFGLFAIWFCLLQGGVNADVAGVAVAAAVPANAIAPKDSEAVNEAVEASYMSFDGEEEPPNYIDHLVHYIAPYTTKIVMPFFALANCGVALGGWEGFMKACAHPAAIGVFAGLLLGKPLGIAGITWLSVQLKIGAYPRGMKAWHLAILGPLGGIGFTMSLFLAALSFPNEAVTSAAKLGILLASVLSAIVGCIAMSMAKPPKQMLPWEQEGAFA